jgi:hypothetical protein
MVLAVVLVFMKRRTGAGKGQPETRPDVSSEQTRSIAVVTELPAKAGACYGRGVFVLDGSRRQMSNHASGHFGFPLLHSDRRRYDAA